MGFKEVTTLFIIAACIFLFKPNLSRGETLSYITLSSFCLQNHIEYKYNINYSFIELSKMTNSLRIYLTLPYIVHGGNVIYMKEILKINSKGDIELPPDYTGQIDRVLNKATPEKEATNLKPLPLSNETIKKDDLTKKSNYNIQGNEKGFSPIDTIIIDPGHGGKDPGGLGVNGIKEKEIVLAVSRLLYQFLKKDGKLGLIFTRKGDEYVTLKERTDITDKLLKKGKNPVFISIHGNISLNRNIKGVEIYSLSDRATDEEALSVEMIENAGFSKSDIDKTEGFYFIITDLLKDAVRRQSEQLAKEIGNYMHKTTSAEIRGIKKANFYVLKYSSLPSVLVEIGFLSQSQEAKKLLNREYQNKIALGISNGIIAFIHKYNETRGFTQ